MSVSTLREEYDLSLDDIRWYLATRITDSLLSQRETPHEITHRVWSGSLEAELYQMEERFLRDLQDELDRNLIDDQIVREHFDKARILKIRRYSR
ncbi:MAG: hypothetical protein ACOC2Y_08095 [Spirochaetota bacterium]